MTIKNYMNPYEIIGELKSHTILIIADHASNIVADDIELGIDDNLLSTHIAVDIGVKTVSEMMVERYDIFAIMATQSRLIIDLNRQEDDAGLIPVISDGIEISGNIINQADRLHRIERFHRPYHAKVAEIVKIYKPSLILALHSFTPTLQSDPDIARPWETGVMYGPSENVAKLAIEYLRASGFVVGDQLPYTGMIWNATMDRHAEPNNIPYFGLEMRQDLVATKEGCERFAQILGDLCLKITKTLASH